MKQKIKDKRKHKKLNEYFANTLYEDMRGGAGKVQIRGPRRKKRLFPDSDPFLPKAPGAEPRRTRLPPPPPPPPPDNPYWDIQDEVDPKELSNQIEELRLTLKGLGISQLIQWANIQKIEENYIKEHLEEKLGLNIDVLNDIFSEKWYTGLQGKLQLQVHPKIKDDIKTELINLIVDDFKINGKVCKLGKYNLLECKNIDKPCIWNNERGVQECLDMDASTRKGEKIVNKPSQTHAQTQAGVIQSSTDLSGQPEQPDPSGQPGQPNQSDQLDKLLENIDFTELEYIKNSIQSHINSIKNEKDKDNINKRLFEFNREYGKIKSKLDLIGSILRNNRKNPNYFNLENALNEQKSKLSEYENDSKYFRDIINSIMIKKKEDKYDDNRRDNRRYDDKKDDKKDDKRDYQLNQKLQKYDQEQKEIGRLNKEIEREKPKRPEGIPDQRPQQGMPQRPQQGMPQRPQQGMPQRPQQGMPQRPQQGIHPQQMPGQKLRIPGQQGIDQKDPKMTFRKGIDRWRDKHQPKRLKDIDREKYVFEKKEQEDKLPREKLRPDVKRFDKKVENKYVPDVKIDKYAVNDLMYILKDVKHSDKDKFYNILNNEYLYRNSNIDEYLLNIDNYLLDRYRLFMERLSKDNTEEEKLAIIQLLTEVNKKPKRKTINKRNK